MLKQLEELCERRSWALTTRRGDPWVVVDGLVRVAQIEGEVRAYGYAIGSRVLDGDDLLAQVESAVDECKARARAVL